MILVLVHVRLNEPYRPENMLFRIKLEKELILTFS